MTAFTSLNLQGWRSCIFAWLIVDTVIFVNSWIEMTVYNCVGVEIMNSSVPTQQIVIDQTFDHRSGPLRALKGPSGPLRAQTPSPPSDTPC